MNPYILAYALFHIACAILSHGIFFAYLQREFPTIAKERARSDFAHSLIPAVLFGSFNLLVVLTCTRFAKHGLLFWPEHPKRD